MAATNELTLTVQRLRNAAPQQFEDFRAAFRHYTSIVTKELVLSENKLAQMQGQAQQCLNFLDILEKAR